MKVSVNFSLEEDCVLKLRVVFVASTSFHRELGVQDSAILLYMPTSHNSLAYLSKSSKCLQDIKGLVDCED